ncbi:MAG: hypothetical protein ACFE0K_15185 [Alcanivorax sp.]|uniref:hypothetical protein n=1 Tax=Alcanivorax sp. TaxID=1872427 RepID=UPI003DA70C19
MVLVVNVSARSAPVYRYLLCGLLFGMSLVGCSSEKGGESSAEAGNGEPAAEKVAIHVNYPTPNANVGGLRSASMVTGAVYLGGDGFSFPPYTLPASVSINGVEAALDEMTGAWSAQVPVVSGRNVLQVEASIGEKTASKTIEIDNSPFLINPVSSVWDDGLERLLVFDQAQRSLLSLYPESGELKVVSSSGLADGPVPLDPVAMTANSSYAWVLDYDQGRVFEINLVDGGRRLLQPSDSEGEIEFRGSSSNEIVLDELRHRLLVSDLINGAIIAIDISTGNRSYFSSTEVGSGPLFRSPGPLMIDSKGERLLVVDLYGDDRLVSVDLLTGDRVDIDHVDLGNWMSLFWDTEDNSLLMIEKEEGSGDFILSSSAINNGEKEVRAGEESGLDIGEGGFFNGDLYPGGDTWWLFDNDAVLLGRLSEGSGNQQKIWDGKAEAKVGVGPDLLSPEGVEYASHANQIWVADPGQDSLFSVDVETGRRMVISGPGVGDGASMESPQDVVYDTGNHMVIVADLGSKSLVKVDPVTGRRDVLSGLGKGAGSDFRLPLSLVVDENSGAAYVADGRAGSVVRVDVASGDRSLFPVFSPLSFLDEPGIPTHVALTPNGSVLLAGSQFSRMVQAYELPDGNESGSRFHGVFPRGMDLSSKGDAFISANGLWRFDIESGEKVNVSGLKNPQMPRPSGVVLDERGGRAFVVDQELNAALVVELKSGQWAVFSR